jgi:hypothetical protein
MSDAFDRSGAEPGDQADRPDGGHSEVEPVDAERYPWDEDPPPDDPDAPRQRHDAFTEAKKSVWLRALVKTGCIQDACRLTDVSPRTIYRHQQNDPIFFEHCRIALRVSGTPAELTAWSRAVEGVEQEFACGGQVHVRRRYSDGLLRLILQGSNPKKYGPHPGFKRKRILKHERKQMEREIRAQIAAEQKPWSFEEAIGAVADKLGKMDADGLMARYSPGWTKTEDGHWIPPGYGPIPGWQPPAGPDGADSAGGEAAAGADTPRDSM